MFSGCAVADKKNMSMELKAIGTLRVDAERFGTFGEEHGELGKQISLRDNLENEALMEAKNEMETERYHWVIKLPRYARFYKRVAIMGL